MAGYSSDDGSKDKRKEVVRREECWIRDRLSQVLNLQSFLIAGYGVALNAAPHSADPKISRCIVALQEWIPRFGWQSGVIFWIGICAAHRVIWKTISGVDRSERIDLIGCWPTHVMGALSPLTIPLLLVCGWLMLLWYSGNGLVGWFETDRVLEWLRRHHGGAGNQAVFGRIAMVATLIQVLFGMTLQIRKIIKDHSIKGLSFGAIITAGFGFLTWTVYASLKPANLYVFVPNLFGVALSIAILIVMLRVRYGSGN